ncbi:hypothetical protein [Persicobacter psychrovividus]
MEIIFKHTWIMFIAVTFANGLILKYRSKKYIAQNPELEKGYDKYFKGLMIYGNIPWVIMMVGNLSGITQSTFEYFNPKAMNPMVLIFHLSIIMLWALGMRWIYFKNGAEFIETHPGLMQKSSFSGNTNVTAKQIKLLFPLMLLGGIAGMIMMWFMNFPTPQF